VRTCCCLFISSDEVKEITNLTFFCRREDRLIPNRSRRGISPSFPPLLLVCFFILFPQRRRFRLNGLFRPPLHFLFLFFGFEDELNLCQSLLSRSGSSVSSALPLLVLFFLNVSLECYPWTLVSLTPIPRAPESVKEKTVVRCIIYLPPPATLSDYFFIMLC